MSHTPTPPATDDMPETLTLNASCPYDGCDGEIMFADHGEVYDGEEAHCDTCGRLAVAVAYEGGTMGCQTREEPNEDD